MQAWARRRDRQKSLVHAAGDFAPSGRFLPLAARFAAAALAWGAMGHAPAGQADIGPARVAESVAADDHGVPHYAQPTAITAALASRKIPSQFPSLVAAQVGEFNEDHPSGDALWRRAVRAGISPRSQGTHSALAVAMSERGGCGALPLAGAVSEAHPLSPGDQYEAHGIRGPPSGVVIDVKHGSRGSCERPNEPMPTYPHKRRL